MRKGFAVMLGVIALAVMGSSSWADVAINAANFPDENFRNYVSRYCDKDSDGVLSDAEITSTTGIGISIKEIKTLKGIEYFTALRELQCHNNQLTALDVSNNTALTRLDCDYNQLTALDVSHNTALTELRCDSNKLTELDVRHNTALTSLVCTSNKLTALDVSNNTALTSLWCYHNQLTELDLSHNTALTRLNCGHNQLTALDVSNNTALTDLLCEYNRLTMLDLSHNTALGNVKTGIQNTYHGNITQSGNASYPYKLDLSSYVSSNNLTKVSDVHGLYTNDEIATTYSNGIAYFASKPARVTYKYATGYSGSSGLMHVHMYVSISDTASDTTNTAPVQDQTTTTTPDTQNLSGNDQSTTTTPGTQNLSGNDQSTTTTPDTQNLSGNDQSTTTTPNTQNLTSDDQSTASTLPVGIIQPVELSRDVLLKVAAAVSIDVSQLHYLAAVNISDPREPTQAMQDYIKSQNTEFTGKLNTISVDKSGYYVFKVTLSDELYALVKDKPIADYKFYGLNDSESQVKASFITGLLNTYELLTMTGGKLEFGVKEFLMVGLLNAGTPFSVYLTKILLFLLAGGCNSGILAGSAVILAVIAFKFRKH